MKQIKAWWKSKTINTSILGIIVSALAGFGILPEGMNSVEVLAPITAALYALTAWFRAQATKVVGAVDEIGDVLDKHF